MNSQFHSQAITHCRLCRTELPVSPIIDMAPFPIAAQHFPKSNEVADESTHCTVFQCPSCSLVQLKIKPVHYYKSVITAAVLSPAAKEIRFNEIKSFVEKYQLSDKRALEVGCGKGGMLDVIEDSGLHAAGVEFEQEFVDEALSHNRSVCQSYLSDLSVSEVYDVIFSFNYLEHQPDIAEFLTHLGRITTNDAHIYITVPNLDYLLKTNSFYEFVPDHLVYFTAETLEFAFRMHGFDVLEASITNNENDILLIAKKRKPLNIGQQYAEVEALQLALNELVESYVSKGKKIAVWGAGHRTLALLALSNLHKISAIVDSAPFKQGLYSPVLLTPIISPTEFENSDIDAVIVAVPGIYPKEVMKTIKGFEKQFDIYCLEDNRVVSYCD